MRVVLSTYPGSFRLPKDVRLWLLREREAFHLFSSMPIEDGNFVLHQVERLIYDEDVDYAGTYDDTWGWFNSFLVHLEEQSFYGIKFSLKSGEEHRDDPELLKGIERFEPDDFEIIEAPQNFQVKTGRHGEYLLNRNSIDPNE